MWRTAGIPVNLEWHHRGSEFPAAITDRAGRGAATAHVPPFNHLQHVAARGERGPAETGVAVIARGVARYVRSRLTMCPGQPLPA